MPRTYWLRAVVIVLLAGSGTVILAQAPTPAAADDPGLTRTVLTQADLSIPGRETVVMRVQLAPGAQVGWHTHPGEEISYLTQGTVTLMIAGQAARTVSVGQALIVPAGAVHNARNDGTVPAGLVAVYVVEKGQPLRSPAPAPGAASASAAAPAPGAAAASSPAPPRFPQLTLEQLNDAQRPLAQYVMGFSSVGIGGPYNLLLRSPGAAKPMLDLLDYLRFHTSVPTRLNEFAILIQGRAWRSQVEWHAHYPLALKAGVSEQTLAGLKALRRPDAMQPDEAAVYDFTTELYRNHEVSDATYARLHQFLSDRQMIDLTLVNGAYIGLASLMAMGQQGLPPGVEPAFRPGEP
jgi:4-carboxymuconolactone decarboxylase